MKNYSEMSNQEIALRVAKLHEKYEDIVFNEGDYVELGDGANWRKFDPCNNPSDAWPIILENEVSLNPRCTNGEWKAQIHIGKNDIFDEYASCWDNNPLRASMIVYLMMKDAENE